MTDEIYRRGHRVEVREREPTSKEAARVERELARWNADVVRQHKGRMNQPLPSLAAAGVAIVVGLVLHRMSLVFAGGAVGAFLVVLTAVARRKSLALVARSRGPWHAPDGAWRVRETRVFARSIACAASGDEDYATWLLFEVPGGEWFYVDSLCLPVEWTRDPTKLARAEVRVARLWPHGPYLDVRATGDAIEHRGPDDYAELVAAERVWRPSEEDAGADGLVAESTLPAWLRRERP